VQVEIETGLRNQLLSVPAIMNLASGQVYNQQAPETARHPFIIFDVNAGGSVNRTANRYFDGRYLVKAVTTNGDVGANSAETAAILSDAIYETLHEQNFALDGDWQLVRCQHVTVVKYVENQSNRQYWHNGGIYRVRAYGGDL
jgi:Protein of unknown function (DUF3168)